VVNGEARGVDVCISTSLGTVHCSSHSFCISISESKPCRFRSLNSTPLQAMSPSILIVGATGNTGKAVVKTLSALLPENKTLSGYRIIALTRSSSSATAQSLSKLPGIEFEEINWPEIDEAWLRERNVERAFIASHNQPNHFAHESTFLREALEAGVKYVVRISTTGANVTPANRAYYPRAHWAIEQMLSQPEYAAMHWSSLQPNVFLPLWLSPAADFIKQYRKTGKQETLRLWASQDAKNAPIDPDEIGVVAAHLLMQEYSSKYNHSKLVLNGPVDITGKDIVKMVEDRIGAKVENVSWKDMSFLEGMAAASSEPRNVIMSIKYAPVTGWEGKTTASTTTRDVLELAAPKRTPTEVLEDLLKQ
jgi:uncharacterized protein YbjT (DUF2867 family)